jgi:hypothetical protein
MMIVMRLFLVYEFYMMRTFGSGQDKLSNMIMIMIIDGLS